MNARSILWCCLALAAWLAAGAAGAGEAVPTTDNPALEARVNRLAAELRCLVCQNQSLADSHAPLAIDLKNQVREQLRAGRADEEVISYMTARYGDFVLYRPPWKATTALLWAGPALLMAVAIGGLSLALKRHTRQGPTSSLSDEETRRAGTLLAEGPGPAPR